MSFFAGGPFRWHSVLSRLLQPETNNAFTGMCVYICEINKGSLLDMLGLQTANCSDEE